MPRFFQYRTLEFATFPNISSTPWECVRGMDRSFGYNSASGEADFLTRNELLRLVVDTAAKGGNLLLIVGPRGDAVIPDEQLTRLSWLAERVSAHHASIVGTRPWVSMPRDDPPRDTTSATAPTATRCGPTSGISKTK